MFFSIVNKTNKINLILWFSFFSILLITNNMYKWFERMKRTKRIFLWIMIHQKDLILLTCSKDLRPASLPHESISSIINCLTCGLAHNTLNVPGIPFSTAQHFTTSTSGITIPTTHDFRDSPWTNTWWTYWLRK